MVIPVCRNMITVTQDVHLLTALQERVQDIQILKEPQQRVEDIPLLTEQQPSRRSKGIIVTNTQSDQV